MTTPTPEHPALTAVRKSGSSKVKVAVSDIDGVLRGKYLHIDKFLGAAEPSPGGGFGFCDVVFGWDMADQTYDNTTLTGWQHGFPDALARLDLGDAAQRAVGRQRAVLPRRVRQRRPHAVADLPAPDPEAGARSAPRRWASRRCAGMEFEWFNFAETPQSWAAKQGVDPTPITPGMFGYSLLRMNHKREFMNALMDEMLAFGVPIEGLHTETGPGVYEVAIAFGEALEQADRAILFKTGAQGDRRALRHHAELHGQVERGSIPGCSGHIHQSLKEGKDGKTNLFYDEKLAAQDERAVRELPRRPGGLPDGVRADVLADHQQLQAPGRRLLGAGQADLGHGQPDRELSRHRRQPEGDPPRDALPRRRRQPLHRDGGGDRRRPATASRRAGS